MYFFETIIFVVVALILGLVGFIFGKKGKDAFKDLKNIFRKKQ